MATPKGNDFFLEFGTNADTFASNLVEQADIARGALNNLVQAAETANKTMQQGNTQRATPLQSMQAAMNQAARQMANIMGQATRSMDEASQKMEGRMGRLADTMGNKLSGIGTDLKDMITQLDGKLRLLDEAKGTTGTRQASAPATDRSATGTRPSPAPAAKTTNSTQVADDELVGKRTSAQRNMRSLDGALTSLSNMAKQSASDIRAVRQELKEFTKEIGRMPVKLQGVQFTVDGNGATIPINLSGANLTGTAAAGTAAAPAASPAAAPMQSVPHTYTPGSPPPAQTSTSQERLAQTPAERTRQRLLGIYQQATKAEESAVSETERLSATLAKLNAFRDLELARLAENEARARSRGSAKEQARNVQGVYAERRDLERNHAASMEALNDPKQGARTASLPMGAMAAAEDFQRKFMEKHGIPEAMRLQELNVRAGGSPTGQQNATKGDHRADRPLPGHEWEGSYNGRLEYKDPSMVSMSRALGGMTKENIAKLPQANLSMENYKKAYTEEFTKYIETLQKETPEFARSQVPVGPFRTVLTNLDKALIAHLTQIQGSKVDQYVENLNTQAVEAAKASAAATGEKYVKPKRITRLDVPPDELNDVEQDALQPHERRMLHGARARNSALENFKGEEAQNRKVTSNYAAYEYILTAIQRNQGMGGRGITEPVLQAAMLNPRKAGATIPRGVDGKDLISQAEMKDLRQVIKDVIKTLAELNTATNKKDPTAQATAQAKLNDIFDNRLPNIGTPLFPTRLTRRDQKRRQEQVAETNKKFAEENPYLLNPEQAITTLEKGETTGSRASISDLQRQISLLANDSTGARAAAASGAAPLSYRSSRTGEEIAPADYESRKKEVAKDLPGLDRESVRVMEERLRDLSAKIGSISETPEILAEHAQLTQKQREDQEAKAPAREARARFQGADFRPTFDTSSEARTTGREALERQIREQYRPLLEHQKVANADDLVKNGTVEAIRKAIIEASQGNKGLAAIRPFIPSERELTPEELRERTGLIKQRQDPITGLKARRARGEIDEQQEAVERQAINARLRELKEAVKLSDEEQKLAAQIYLENQQRRKSFDAAQASTSKPEAGKRKHAEPERPEVTTNASDINSQLHSIRNERTQLEKTIASREAQHYAAASRNPTAEGAAAQAADLRDIQGLRRHADELDQTIVELQAQRANLKRLSKAQAAAAAEAEAVANRGGPFGANSPIDPNKLPDMRSGATQNLQLASQMVTSASGRNATPGERQAAEEMVQDAQLDKEIEEEQLKNRWAFTTRPPVKGKGEPAPAESAPSAPKHQIPPVPEASKFDLDSDEGLDQFDKARIAFQQAVHEALQRGQITLEEATRLAKAANDAGADFQAGNAGPERFQNLRPLPNELYHVTTAKDAVLREGLKTPLERDPMAGTEGAAGKGYSGLGGGPAFGLSLTADAEAAKAIKEALLQANSVLRGTTTLQELLEQAKKGGFAEDWAQLSGHTDPDALGRRMGLIDKQQEEGDLTPDQAAGEKFGHYKDFLNARDNAGKGMNPLFFGTDPKAVRDLDPSQIDVMRLAPSAPGMSGYRPNTKVEDPLSELEVVSGRMVKVLGTLDDPHPKGAGGDAELTIAQLREVIGIFERSVEELHAKNKQDYENHSARKSSFDAENDQRRALEGFRAQLAARENAGQPMATQLPPPSPTARVEPTTPGQTPHDILESTLAQLGGAAGVAQHSGNLGGRGPGAAHADDVLSQTRLSELIDSSSQAHRQETQAAVQLTEGESVLADAARTSARAQQEVAQQAVGRAEAERAAADVARSSTASRVEEDTNIVPDRSALDAARAMRAQAQKVAEASGSDEDYGMVGRLHEEVSRLAEQYDADRATAKKAARVAAGGSGGGKKGGRRTASAAAEPPPEPSQGNVGGRTQEAASATARVMEEADAQAAAGVREVGASIGRYQQQWEEFSEATRQRMEEMRTQLADALSKTSGRDARGKLLVEAGAVFKSDPAYKAMQDAPSRYRLFRDAMGLNPTTEDYKVSQRVLGQGGLITEDPRFNRGSSANSGQPTGADAIKMQEAVEQHIKQILGGARESNPLITPAQIASMAQALRTYQLALLNQARVLNNGTSTQQQVASALRATGAANARMQATANTVTNGLGINVPPGPAHSPWANVGNVGGPGVPGGPGGTGRGGIGGPGTPGGGGPSPLQRSLFGQGGFGAGLLRHAGLALENQISYSLTFQGMEKLHELVTTGIEAQQGFVRLQASVDALHIPIGNLKNDLIGISSSTAQPIQHVAEAAAELTGTLKNAGDIKAGTNIAAQLANVSQGTLTATEAAKGLRDVTQAYGLHGAAQIQAVGDEIAHLSEITGVSIKDITEGTTQLAQEAHHFGLSQNQAAVLSAEVTRNTGETGESSAEQVSRIMSTLNNGKVQQLLVQTQVATKQQFQTGDLAGVMGNLLEKFDKLSPSAQQAITALVGTGRQARAFSGLLNDASSASEFFNNKQASTGTLARLNQAYLATLGGAMKKLSEDFQNVGAQLMQLGAFDAFAVLIKGVDMALQAVNALLGGINSLANSNPLTKFAKEGVVAVGGLLIAFKALQALYNATIGRIMGGGAAGGAAAAAGGGGRGRGGLLGFGGGAGAGTALGGYGGGNAPGRFQRIFGGSAYGPRVAPTAAPGTGFWTQDRSVFNPRGGYGGIFRPAMPAGTNALRQDAATGRMYAYQRPPLQPTPFTAAQQQAMQQSMVPFGPTRLLTPQGMLGGLLQAGGRGLGAAGTGIGNLATATQSQLGPQSRLASMMTATSRAAINGGTAVQNLGTRIQSFAANSRGAQMAMTGLGAAFQAFMIILPFLIQSLEKSKQMTSDANAAFAAAGLAPDPNADKNDPNRLGGDALNQGDAAAAKARNPSFGDAFARTAVAAFSLGTVTDFGGRGSGGVTSEKYDKQSSLLFQRAVKTLRDAGDPKALAQAESDVDNMYKTNAEALVKSAGDRAAQVTAQADLEHALQGLRDIGAKRQATMDGLNAADLLNETQIAAIGTYVQNVSQFNSRTLAQIPDLAKTMGAQTLVDPNGQDAPLLATSADPNATNAQRRAAQIQLLQHVLQSGNERLKTPYYKDLLEKNPNDPTAIGLKDSLTAQANQLQQLQDQQATVPAQQEQAAAGLNEQTGHFSMAISQLQSANDMWANYASQLSSDDPNYMTALKNIQDNKVKIAELQADPLIQQLTIQAAGTADPVQRAQIQQQLAIQQLNIANAAAAKARVASTQVNNTAPAGTGENGTGIANLVAGATGTAPSGPSGPTLAGPEASPTAPASTPNAYAGLSATDPHPGQTWNGQIGSPGNPLPPGYDKMSMPDLIQFINSHGGSGNVDWASVPGMQDPNGLGAAIQGSLGAPSGGPAGEGSDSMAANKSAILRAAAQAAGTGVPGPGTQDGPDPAHGGTPAALTPEQATAQAAVQAANLGKAQAAEQETEAANAAKAAAIRNQSASLQAQMVEKQRQINVYSDGQLKDATKVAQLNAEMTQLQQQNMDLAQSILEAQGEVSATTMETHGDLVGAAKKRADDAHAHYEYYKKQFGADDERTLQAQIAMIQADKANFVSAITQATAVAENAATFLDTAGAAQGGDIVAAGNKRAQAAQDAYKKYLALEGPQGADTLTAGATAMQAARNAFDISLNQQLDVLDFQQQTYQITSTQEIASLQQILKNKQLTAAEQRNLVTKIHTMQETIRQQLTQGGLNIPSDIKLPTAYQIRRSLGPAAGAGASQAIVTNNNTRATNNVTISNQGVSANDMARITQAVVAAVSTATGQSVRANTATPSLVNRGG